MPSGNKPLPDQMLTQIYVTIYSVNRPLITFDYKSKMFQVMARSCQATSHYLNQFWLRFMSPYDVTRPKWVNLGDNEFIYVVSIVSIFLNKIIHVMTAMQVYQLKIHWNRNDKNFFNMTFSFHNCTKSDLSQQHQTWHPFYIQEFLQPHKLT